MQGTEPMTLAERPDADLADAFLTRVKGEYCEMPGLCLTPAQAARLWSVDVAVATLALRQLAESGYLRRRLDGAYALTDGARRTCAWFLDP
jgi:hypothetical protein